MSREIRKIHEHAGMCLICVPKWWVRTHGLRVGDSIILNSDFPRLIIEPIHSPKLKEKNNERKTLRDRQRPTRTK